MDCGRRRHFGNNRRAKFYRLTAAGRRQLAVETSKWDRIARAIARWLHPKTRTTCSAGARTSTISIGRSGTTSTPKLATTWSAGCAKTRREARPSASCSNVARVKEDVRDVWVPAWWDSCRQDARDAVRRVRRNPGFALAIAVTLALGIGLTTAIFSVVNAVLLRPLSYPHPERVVWMTTRNPGAAY